MSKQQTTPSAKKPARVKKKAMQNVPVAIVHVRATFNNTIVTVTDPAGRVIGWGSAGKVNFSGSRKSSAFAGTLTAQRVTEQVVKEHGVRECEVRLNGAGAGRESAVRAVQASGVTITGIKDVTPIPHNGCRPRKQRRV